MKLAKLSLLAIGSVILLASCNGGEKKPETPVKPEAAPAAQGGGDSIKGGQVIESGKYHLELKPEKAADKTHLDFYLKIDATQKDIPDAKVSGVVQTPDGKEAPVTFTYDAKDKHYAANIPGKAAGTYNLKITANIGSEKANGRFTFNR
jgi:hypothetical protein